MLKRRLVILLVVLTLLFCACDIPRNVVDIPINEGIPDEEEYVNPEIGIKDALNPLTGEYNLSRDQDGKRVFAVCIDNINQTPPQYGISKADVIFEVEVEGGITRLLCMYSDIREIERIGNIRSLRDQIMEAAAYMDPVFIYWGNAVCSEYLFEQNKNIASLDCVGNSIVNFMLTFDDHRVRNQATQALYSSEFRKCIYGNRIDDTLQAVGLTDNESRFTGTIFDFVTDDEVPTVPSTGASTHVSFTFSDGPFFINSCSFEYKEFLDTYYWSQYDRLKTDGYYEDKVTSFQNVLILFADVTRKTSPYDALTNIRYQSGGKGIYLTGGRYEDITWGKGELFEEFWFKRADGTPLKLNTGKTYVGVVSQEMRDYLVIE